MSVLRPTATRREFEATVAARVGARYGLTFAYAHAGFFALLKALGLVGAEVIIPAYTCNIMPEVIIATGNVPVFVDIDLADYNMDLDALKSAITPDTKVIVATHMFGYPTDVDAIREIARDHTGDERIFIVEDAALMFPGATGSLDGLRGDVGLFSFGPGKPLFTIRGGVLVTNDIRLYERIRIYRDQQMNSLPPEEWAKRWGLLVIHYLLSRRAIHSLTGRLNLSKNSLHNLVSRLRPAQDNGRVNGSLLPDDYVTGYADFQARIGLTQLRKSDHILSQRRALARLYDDALRDISGLTPAPLVDGASYSLYTVRVKNRDSLGFCERMRARGIETGQTFSYALPAQERYRPYVQGTYPYAEQTSREVVNLPAYPDLTAEQVHYVADNIRQVLQISS